MVKVGAAVGSISAPSTPEARTPRSPSSPAEPPEGSDQYASSGPSAFVPSKKAPSLGRSSKLLEVVLTADKSKLTSAMNEEGKKASLDRDLAKHVGLILATTPYGAPFELIQDRLLQDPFIAERLPGAKLPDLRLLHKQYPEIVPLPTLPVDFGSPSLPSMEGYLDLFATRFFLQAPARFDPVIRRYGNKDRSMGGAKAAADRRYLIPTSDMSGSYIQQPDASSLVRQVERYYKQLGLAGIFLRRAIDNAPPTWSIEQITEEHNRYVDFYAAALSNGDEASFETAKSKARMTPERVRDIMEKVPNESGAAALAKRQERLREALVSALDLAKPGENLYSLLERVAESLAKQPKPAAPYGHKAYPTPPVEASLTPEDLAAYISGDVSFAPQLDALMSGRSEGLDKRLAQHIATKLGSRLDKMSVTEIARVMAKEDPVYTDEVTRHLISSFPKVFGTKRVERKPIESNFLLANQLASVMDKMFKGATLDDVAAFMKSQNPDLAAAYPDFTADDVKLLQAAYDFVPKWTTKTIDTLLPTVSTEMPLDGFAKLATKQLGSDRAAVLQQVIFDHLKADFEGDAVPPAVARQVDLEFRTALLGLVVKTAGLRPMTAGRTAPEADALHRFEDFLAGVPEAAVTITEAGIEKILTQKGLYERPPGEAMLTAKALMAAHRLDFAGLRQSFDALIVGKPGAEVAGLKLDSLTLGYEGLGARLERDVFRNEELKASFKRSARIPFSLPMIQAVVKKYEKDQPLKDQNVLMVQHMLGQAFPQVSGYTKLGMNPDDAIFVGIPYHKNHEVEDALVRSFGIDVRVPPKDMVKLYEAIEKGVDDTVAKHLQNGHPMLIVCDGPHARDYFRKKYPHLADKARFTEQTAFGDRPEQWADKSIRVVSYARTELKAKKEAKFIAQAVARAVNAVLTKLGTGYEQKPVLIMGLGPIGLATGEAFVGDRAEVYAYDPNLSPAMRAEAEKLGIKVITDSNNITAGKFMVIGCSGHRSIDEEQILASDPNSIYVSASSKLVEINMKRLAELATDEEGRLRKVLAAEVNNQQTWHYWLKDGTIRTVVADGLPANFNDVNSVPPEFIDMTMGMSLAAAVQTVSKDDKGFYGLNDEDHDMLNQVFEGMLERMRKEAELNSSIETKIEDRLGQ
ncbi:MAG: hypothetical protein HYV07_18275 [Deltaproteobacteria bacterium]|nr:hypothetical protein [Deltaproteobacteria bacterium]